MKASTSLKSSLLLLVAVVLQQANGMLPVPKVIEITSTGKETNLLSLRGGFNNRNNRNLQNNSKNKNNNRNNRNNNINRRRRRRGEPEPVIDPNIRPISAKTCVAIGTILALNSGIINGVCLSGIISPQDVKQGSTAVTAAWSNSALGLASGNTSQFLLNFKCILSYMAGSFISGFVNANPKPFEVNIASFRTALMIGSMLLYGSSVLSEEEDTNVFIFLAAMANGIQNSLTSTTTGNLVRSSHFSGITSDIGTFAGQVFRGNVENWKKLRVFMTLAASFWTGGYISYSLAMNYGSKVLLFSSILYLLLALVMGSV